MPNEFVDFWVFFFKSTLKGQFISYSPGKSDGHKVYLNNFQCCVEARQKQLKKNYIYILQAPVGDLFPSRANRKVPVLGANGGRRRLGVGGCLRLEGN